MYMERVSVLDGTIPLLVVAPHGVDDASTDIIAEVMATKLNCHAVINRGWERADNIDVNNDKGNCNSIAHCHQPVIKDEFLDPLLRYMHRSAKTIYVSNSKAANRLPVFLSNHKPLMISIHGVGDQIRTKLKDNNVDFILGVGNGKPPRPTCGIWRLNALAWTLTNRGIHPWQGQAGSPYAAWGQDNLTQLFNQKHNGLGEAIQIEILRTPWRDSTKHAESTGDILAKVFLELMLLTNLNQFAGDLGIPKC